MRRVGGRGDGSWVTGFGRGGAGRVRGGGGQDTMEGSEYEEKPRERKGVPKYARMGP